MTRIQRSAGLNNPLQKVFPLPILANRAPTSSDKNYQAGQVWIDKSDNKAWFLTSVVAGSATWALASPGASDVDTLTGDSGGAISPAAGNITLAGGTNVTTAGAGSTITFNLDAAITLATSVSSPLYTVAAATDLAITAAAGQDIVMKMGDAAGANKVSFVDSADVEVAAIDSNGGFTMGAITFTGLLTAEASATIETAGTALNLGSDNSGDAVNLGVGTVARAINVGTSAAAHVISLGNAAAGAITVDTAAGISLDAATASNFTVTGAADLTLASTGGSVISSSAQAAADAIRIVASDAAGGIDIDCGTAGAALDSTGAISLDAAAASNFSVSGAGIDLSMISAGGRVVMNGEEAAADALKLLSAAGGLDADVALQMSLVSSQVAADAIVINSSAGGIQVTATTNDLALEASTASISLTAAEADAAAIALQAAAGGLDIDLGLALIADAAGNLELNSSAGQILIGNDDVDQNASFATDGERVVTVGSINGAASLVLQAGTGNITATGTFEQVDAKIVKPTGFDITLKSSPLTCTAANTGGVATGTTGAINLLSFREGIIMEQFIIGAGQTIIKPVMDSSGLLISLDLVNTEGAEYNFGAARSLSEYAFTIGTSAAFFFEVTMTLADISGGNPYLIGFRKAEANNATFADYTDYYGLGMFGGTSATNITLASELNAGGQTLQDSTTAWTGGDGGTTTLKVLVSAAGVVTATIDGGAPGAPLAYTFDNADVVCPFIRITHGAAAPGAVHLVDLSVGFQ
jgi:hypothetical protein